MSITGLKKVGKKIPEEKTQVRALKKMQSFVCKELNDTVSNALISVRLIIKKSIYDKRKRKDLLSLADIKLSAAVQTINQLVSLMSEPDPTKTKFDKNIIPGINKNKVYYDLIDKFSDHLEKNFMKEHSPCFYARLLGI